MKIVGSQAGRALNSLAILWRRVGLLCAAASHRFGRFARVELAFQPKTQRESQPNRQADAGEEQDGEHAYVNQYLWKHGYSSPAWISCVIRPFGLPIGEALGDKVQRGEHRRHSSGDDGGRVHDLFTRLRRGLFGQLRETELRKGNRRRGKSGLLPPASLSP